MSPQVAMGRRALDHFRLRLREHLRALEVVNQRKQRSRRQHLDAAGPGRLAALRFRADQTAPRGVGPDRGRQHAGHGRQRAV